MNEADAEAPLVERRPVPEALRRFIWDIQSMVELADGEREILVIGRDLLARLVATDDWLPAAFGATPDGRGAQFQLYRDALDRFTVVSTVLPARCGLEIDQPGLWEIAGVLRGAVMRESVGAEAKAARTLQASAVEARGSAGAEVTRLANACGGRVSIIIHAYGGEIGRLSRRAPSVDGRSGEQPMGYANGERTPPYDIFSIQAEIGD